MTDEKDYKSVSTSVVVDFDENNILDVDEVTETGSGRSRLKAMAKKIIAARRLLTVDNMHSPGQDPGIDPRYADYDVNVNFSEGGFLEKDRPDKTNVRWINVDGISWDVIKTLALKFDLHPLSIEDALQNTQLVKEGEILSTTFIFLKAVNGAI
ncbi:7612_t:CDS:2 [Entrophospora sp. SA101]|nr:7612_t:CDS:2 [Entrophospora sp. SA101]